jgi:hypothetical protein
VRTLPATSSAEPYLPVASEALTRRAVTVITASIVTPTFVLSHDNVARLCLDLGITGARPPESPRCECPGSADPGPRGVVRR